jgi:RNA polymerase sigma factor (TIGR02999 family)
VVYEQLRQVAARTLRRERAGHSLQPTALVHEAYLRLADGVELEFADRAHLLGICARVMRRILIDHARARRSEKRGGKAARITLDDRLHASDARPELDLLALQDALESLAKLNQRAQQVVEMRFFGGLTTQECAEVLGVSVRTVGDDWSFARAWLGRELQA